MTMEPSTVVCSLADAKGCPLLPNCRTNSTSPHGIAETKAILIPKIRDFASRCDLIRLAHGMMRKAIDRFEGLKLAKALAAVNYMPLLAPSHDDRTPGESSTESRACNDIPLLDFS